MWWLRPLCYGEYTYDCKLKPFREMSLNTLTHNQHYVIEVFNLKRKDYTLFGWVYASILIKFSILIIFVHCCKYDMHNFTFSGWQTLPAAPLSSIARRFTRMEWNIQKIYIINSIAKSYILNIQIRPLVTEYALTIKLD